MSSAHLKLANIITSSRLCFGILLVPLFSMESAAARILLFLTACGIFISDLADGAAARKFGSVSPGTPGTVYDLMTDDFVIITAAACLLWKGLLPAWLAFSIIWLRSLMTLTRMMTLAAGAPFAGSRQSTKVKGVVYGLALLFFVGTYSLEPLLVIPYKGEAYAFVIICVAISTFVAAIDFLKANVHVFRILFGI